MGFFKKKCLTPFIAALIAAAVGTASWGITAFAGAAPPVPPQSAAALYEAAVLDAMEALPQETESLVVIEKDSPMVTWNKAGDRVLLLSWHQYPESYAEGGGMLLRHGPVWTFTDREFSAWYKKNKEGVTDWDMRLRQLIGLKPDAVYTHMTAFWVNPRNVLRPAYCQDITHNDMAASFAEKPGKEFHTWFNGKIIESYYEGRAPWTRLGYTYDWADNGRKYGLTEFLIQKDAPVTVAFTKTTREFLQWMDTQ